MALMLPRSVFFHIPKTGGSWVRDAIARAGIPASEVGDRHDTRKRMHDWPRAADAWGKFTFTFVRHPLSWYRSYWAHRMERGWRSDYGADACMSVDFEQFVRNIVRRYPGYLSGWCEAFVGRPHGLLDFVGKQEQLAGDLIRALRLAGEEFDEEAIRQTPMANRTRLRPHYSPDLARAVLSSEKRILERFGYGEAGQPCRVGTADKLCQTVRPAGPNGRWFSEEEARWEKVEPRLLREGDVVTFSTAERAVAISRIVRILQIDGQQAFVTKGDDRLRFDPVVFPDGIFGRITRAGRRDLTQPHWRAAGRAIAWFSYLQAMAYQRLLYSRVNRIRKAFQVRGLLPLLKFRGSWRMIVDPAGDPAANMELDAVQAGQVRRRLAPPTLRIYRWNRPAISLGRSQRVEELPQELLERGLPIVRRPTGGGAVIHQMEDLTYALAAPRSILPAHLPIRQLHSSLHQALRDELIQRIGISPGDLRVAPRDPEGPATLCFSSPVCGDLIYQGRKVAGSALRVWREAFLLQGSIQGFPAANGELQSALVGAVSATLKLECPRPRLKSGI